MANLSELELQYLKYILNHQEIMYQKLINYADNAVDPQIKQAFNKAAQNSLTAKQKLSFFLN